MPYLLPASRIGLRIEGRGPPIVLLHSSMSSKTQWRELIDSLRDRYRLIAIDLLGYGESAMPLSSGSYSLRDEVRLVESLLARELDPGEQFHLIGHSYGGVVALQLAAQAPPHRVRSLSLFEPIAFHLLSAGDPDLAALNEVRSEIAGLLNAGDAHGAASRFVDYWSGAGAFAQLREERQSVLAAQVPKVLLEYCAVADESSAPNYRRIDVPTCVVGGLLSPQPARRLTSMLADILPQASRFEIAAGHMAPITHPALVNPIFEKFICTVDASGYRRANAGFRRAIAVGLSGIVLSTLAYTASDSILQEESGSATHSVYPLEEGAWREGLPGMPHGGKFAVISGDPFAAGPFVIRVRLPPGYVLPPHRQPNDEELIVLAGAITLVDVAESGEATARTLTSGSYASLPASELHFAHTENGATLQIVGIGPFGRPT